MQEFAPVTLFASSASFTSSASFASFDSFDSFLAYFTPASAVATSFRSGTTGMS